MINPSISDIKVGDKVELVTDATILEKIGLIEFEDENIFEVTYINETTEALFIKASERFGVETYLDVHGDESLMIEYTYQVTLEQVHQVLSAVQEPAKKLEASYKLETVVNGKVVSSKEVTFTKKQIKKYSNLIKESQVIDKLSMTSEKDTLKFIKDRLSSFRTNSRKLPTPTFNKKLFAILDPAKNKIPKYDFDYVGVEIECFVPNKHNGIETKDFLSQEIVKRKITGINIGSDGSIDSPGDTQGLEFRCLIPKHNLSSLKKFCELLKEVNADVNKSCGLHVHFDMRNNTKMSFGKKAAKLQRALPFLSKIVSPSRRKNQYCRFEASETNRYSAINKTAYTKYQTLEVRLHQGTVTFSKIENWINLLTKIMDSKFKTYISDQQVIDVCGLDAMLPYINERMNKFNKDIEETSEAAA